jgi:hypothetical protein
VPAATSTVRAFDVRRWRSILRLRCAMLPQHQPARPTALFVTPADAPAHTPRSTENIYPPYRSRGSTAETRAFLRRSSMPGSATQQRRRRSHSSRSRSRAVLALVQNVAKQGERRLFRDTAYSFLAHSSLITYHPPHRHREPKTICNESWKPMAALVMPQTQESVAHLPLFFPVHVTSSPSPSADSSAGTFTLSASPPTHRNTSGR